MKNLYLQYWLLLTIPPAQIVLSNIPHLNTPGWGIGGGVGQYAPLERLEQHIFLNTIHPDLCPIWFADR
jgi:hypothetical protein